MGWSGINNGKFLSLAVQNNFDIFLTIDKNLAFQQNMSEYPITLVIHNSPSSRFKELIEFLLAFEQKLKTMSKHKSYLLEKIINSK